MAHTLLRPLLAFCFSSRALGTTLRSLSSVQTARTPAIGGDELMAMGDADMEAAADAIAESRQSFVTGAMPHSKPHVAAASRASTAERAAAFAANGAAGVEALDQSLSLGNKFSNAMHSAGEKLRAGVSRGLMQAMDRAMGVEYGKKDLAFVHVPMNFGQSVERVGLTGDRAQEFSMLYQSSFEAKKEQNQWNAIKIARGPGGEIWGQMNPELRAISNDTGCNLYQTPQKYWPQDISERYFAGRRAFGLLRDPYDKVVAEFRQLASGGGHHSVESGRQDISEREGTTEREGQEYMDFYENCDVNGWVKAELTRVKEGDIFRGNCHLVPQTEYFQHPHGISLAIDARLIPESFNEAMEEHGYPFRMDSSTVRTNWKCNRISAWSLDEESRALVQDVYAADFDLLCKTFGYCDIEELTCMQQFPSMCGGSPYDTRASLFAGMPGMPSA